VNIKTFSGELIFLLNLQQHCLKKDRRRL
jgi:hypothetical protein